MKILAIDPGASGGLAWNDDGGTHAIPMPETDGDLVDFLRAVRIGVDTVWVEEVGGFIGHPQPGSAMFKFGFGAGVIRGALMAFGFRVELVRPQKWQKHFSLGAKRDCQTSSEWKNKLKEEAIKLFPNQKRITLATADAYLLLHYAIKNKLS
jgi:hypothetical protein